MTTGQIFVGDIGTIFEATIKDQAGAVVDISTATTKQILFKKPTGVVLTKTASFTTTGSDGKIRYTTIAGDLDVSGVWSTTNPGWQWEAYVVMPSGSWHSDICQFSVYPFIS